MLNSEFIYSDERFDDLQLLRYRLNGFEQLSLKQKRLVYYLSQATLFGRDITFDQFGKYNLLIRKTLEVIYLDPHVDHHSDEFEQLTIYLKKVWFSSGIYHHYGCEKFVPYFSQQYFEKMLHTVDINKLPLQNVGTVDGLCAILSPILFDQHLLPKRVNQADGDDLVKTSACNYYEGVTQTEVEAYYQFMKEKTGKQAPSFGLNTKVVKAASGELTELTWKVGGMYGQALQQIVYWLNQALQVTENTQQAKVIQLLIDYYKTGNLRTFDEYSIEWVKELDSRIDFINGFIEVYGDPLGLKGSWEGIVEYIDLEATKRTQAISGAAQCFEDHSPVDKRFKKKQVKGVTAHVICAAMLGGDEYPSTAIGINLPNADWIRAEYGSKSVTIGNLTEAYNRAAKGSGMQQEFVIDSKTIDLLEQYSDVCDDLHTDLHECLGHGSGQLLPGVDPDALKAYGNTIEEARADLFGLYYIADDKMIELGLLPDGMAYQSQYYSYILNGLITQLIRIKPGEQIEEAHMRNRALIAHWCMEQGDTIKYVKREGKTYVEISDYMVLRKLFGNLLAEIQRIKSEGDFEAARNLVERYAIKVDPELHSEVLSRYKKLNLAPYKGFINPWMKPVTDDAGNVTDIQLDYTESYEHQMLRYSRDYGTLI